MRHICGPLRLFFCGLSGFISTSCHDANQRIVPQTTETCVLPSQLSEVPTSLVQGGCFTAAGLPAANLHAYEVNAPLWADGGDKARWMVLAPGASAQFGSDGVLDFPAGSGIFKQFDEGGVRLETRLLFMDASGVLQAASWAWNNEQTDATLVSVGASQTIDNQLWNFPGRAQCTFCHNAKAGSFLGAQYPQLNRTVEADGASVDQIPSLEAQGIISGTIPTGLTSWVDPTGDGNLVVRARSYLAANCSFCHRPDGASGTATDFRFDTPLAGMGLCNVAPTAGSFDVPNARLLAPGNPNASIISYRIHSIDAGARMPPVGRTEEDVHAAQLIDSWISTISTCP